jgi:hypothetical protein
VIEAIRSGPNGRIAVELVEWSGLRPHGLHLDVGNYGPLSACYDWAAGFSVRWPYYARI